MSGGTDVAAVVAIDDPVARNYAISRCYYELSVALAEPLGRSDANWLTFGTWASASAGRFIRGEAAPVRWGAGSVAAGNRAIMADIGPRFRRFIDLARAEGPSDGASPRSADRTSLRRAVASDPLLTANAELAEAFDCYAQATGTARAAGARAAGAAGAADAAHTIDTREARQHAEFMLRANILIAHHEQDLADPHVDDAMPLGGIVGIVATRFVRLSIPEGDLDVCEDVPQPRYLRGARWPAALGALTDPRLRALMQRYGQPLDDMSASNAVSWEDFEERMGYIACFFRAYQQDPSLFELPADLR